MARLTTGGRQYPNLHPLVGIVIGLDFVWQPVREKSELAVVAKFWSSIVALPSRELDRRRSIEGQLPDVAEVFCAIAIQALDSNS